MRTSLFEPASLRLELIKLDCLRVVLPFIIAHRLIPQALSAVCIQKWLEFALSGLGVVLCVLICIGIAESWAAVLLALMLSPVIDNYCFSSNLGSVFATSLLWLIAFSFPGQVFSLHRLLGKNNERVFSRGKFFGRPRLETVAALKFLVLLSYSLVCWESAYRHWQADTWRSGEICCLIFLSPVSNPHFFQFFETFYLNFPVLYTQLFKIVTYSTLIWMSTFPIPLFFGGIIRSLAILFWLSFLLADAFVLPLMGNLGAIQLAMWIVLFCPNVVWKAALLRLRLKRRAEPTSALDKPRFAHNSLYNYSPFAIAYACSVLVFSVVFCLRSPFLDGKWMPAPLTILIRRERAIMGQSFLPVGLTNLNVFNDLDRSIMFLGLDHIFFDHQGKEMKIPYLIPDSMRARFLQRQRSQCAFYYDSLQESVLLEIAAYLKRLNPGLHTYQVNYVSYAEPEFLAAQAGAGARSGKQVDCCVTIDADKQAISSVLYGQECWKSIWKKLKFCPNSQMARLILAIPVPQERAVLEAHMRWQVKHGLPGAEGRELKSLIDYAYDFGVPGPPAFSFFERVCRYCDGREILPGDLQVEEVSGDGPMWMSVESAYNGAMQKCGYSPRFTDSTASPKDRALAVRRWYFDQIFRKMVERT